MDTRSTPLRAAGALTIALCATLGCGSNPSVSDDDASEARSDASVDVTIGPEPDASAADAGGGDLGDVQADAPDGSDADAPDADAPEIEVSDASPDDAPNDPDTGVAPGVDLPLDPIDPPFELDPAWCIGTQCTAWTCPNTRWDFAPIEDLVPVLTDALLLDAGFTWFEPFQTDPAGPTRLALQSNRSPTRLLARNDAEVWEADGSAFTTLTPVFVDLDGDGADEALRFDGQALLELPLTEDTEGTPLPGVPEGFVQHVDRLASGENIVLRHQTATGELELCAWSETELDCGEVTIPVATLGGLMVQHPLRPDAPAYLSLHNTPGEGGAYLSAIGWGEAGPEILVDARELEAPGGASTWGASELLALDADGDGLLDLRVAPFFSAERALVLDVWGRAELRARRATFADWAREENTPMLRIAREGLSDLLVLSLDAETPTIEVRALGVVAEDSGYVEIPRFTVPGGPMMALGDFDDSGEEELIFEVPGGVRRLEFGALFEGDAEGTIEPRWLPEGGVFGPVQSPTLHGSDGRVDALVLNGPADAFHNLALQEAAPTLRIDASFDGVGEGPCVAVPDVPQRGYYCATPGLPRFALAAGSVAQVVDTLSSDFFAAPIYPTVVAGPFYGTFEGLGPALVFVGAGDSLHELVPTSPFDDDFALYALFVRFDAQGRPGVATFRPLPGAVDLNPLLASPFGGVLDADGDGFDELWAVREFGAEVLVWSPNETTWQSAPTSDGGWMWRDGIAAHTLAAVDPDAEQAQLWVLGNESLYAYRADDASEAWVRGPEVALPEGRAGSGLQFFDVDDDGTLEALVELTTGGGRELWLWEPGTEAWRSFGRMPPDASIAFVTETGDPNSGADLVLTGGADEVRILHGVCEGE